MSKDYASDRELVVLYQLLGYAPQVAALLYWPGLNDGVRQWLNDVWDAGDMKVRRWLEGLYLYYGLAVDPPYDYVQVGEALGVTGQTARVLVARGLRYLWFLTHTETASDTADMEVLLRDALLSNEWATCDPSDNVSLENFRHVMQNDGTTYPRTVTPKTPTQVHPTLRHRLRIPPVLWDSEHAEKLWPALAEPARVLMKGGKLV